MKNNKLKKIRFRRALVLVAGLWAIVLLTVIVSALARTSRLDSRVSLAAGEQVRNRWACRAGIERAVAVLNDDDKTSDSLMDLWYDNEDDFNDVELDKCRFSVKVFDEAGKLNVNKATKEQLLGLTGMTDETADAIIDWRDSDDTPGQAGAESGYYAGLQYGYAIRNGPFRTIRELLKVKAVTEELLYGEDTNLNGELDYNEKDKDTRPPNDNGDDVLDVGWVEYLTCYSYDTNKDARGNDRININKADENMLVEKLNIRKSYAKWIVENRKNKYKCISDLINDNSPKKARKESEQSDKAEQLDLETFENIADKITVTDEKTIQGRVNINTASRQVLTALLKGNEQLAESIIAYRRSLPSGMESIGEVLKIESMTVDTFKEIAGQITTRSNVFLIRCAATAEATGSRFPTEVVVDRVRRPAEILYWHQGANN